jgi:hypothetical protein
MFGSEDRMGVASHTEADARVLVTNVLTLLVGEEHVGRQTTLRRVGIFKTKSAWSRRRHWQTVEDVPFFFFSVRALVARLVVFSLGMVKTGVDSERVNCY